MALQEILQEIHDIQSTEEFGRDMTRLAQEENAAQHSCPCCGGRTTREIGLCGRCLDFVA